MSEYKLEMVYSLPLFMPVYKPIPEYVFCHEKILLGHSQLAKPSVRKTDPRFSIVSGRSLKICAIDSVDGPPPNAHLL